MTSLLPITPIVFRPDFVTAASTAWIPCTNGNGEIGSSSLMQKWPPIDVTAATSAPAALRRPINPAKISAWRCALPSVRLRDMERTSACTMVHSRMVLAA
jgi:hypothetical protein